MWHRELKTRGPSGADTLNFLWQDDERPIYIMDNHLGALWCWLRELKPRDAYTLFHIDWHWDTNGLVDGGLQALRAATKKPLSIDDFTNIKAKHPMFRQPIPVVLWENYLTPIAVLRPKLHEAHLVAHQSRSCFDMSEAKKDPRFIRYSVEPFMSQFPSNVEGAVGRVVVNLDLDFFFLSIGEQREVQAFSDEFIGGLLAHVRRAVDGGAILTVALSPECSGGWSQAEALCSMVCRQLGLEFELPA